MAEEAKNAKGTPGSSGRFCGGGKSWEEPGAGGVFWGVFFCVCWFLVTFCGCLLFCLLFFVGFL